ncbi:hypothetical protein KY343_01510 [Candidatus Woesearchaeota archaeon]|nr:hypothetical protein [Candidatus Woesearchaeota archaeon]
MKKIIKYAAGAAAAVLIGWGIGSLFGEKIEYGHNYALYHTDNFVKSNETLDGIFETLSVPGKELQKWMNGWTEEDYQDNYQRCRGEMEKKLGIKNENPNKE